MLCCDCSMKLYNILLDEQYKTVVFQSTKCAKHFIKHAIVTLNCSPTNVAYCTVDCIGVICDTVNNQDAHYADFSDMVI